MKKEITNNYSNCTLTLLTSKRDRAWMSELTGLDKQFTFKRTFIGHCDYGPRWFDFKLEENKIYNWYEDREQHYGIVEDGKLYEISKFDVNEMLNNM